MHKGECMLVAEDLGSTPRSIKGRSSRGTCFELWNYALTRDIHIRSCVDPKCLGLAVLRRAWDRLIGTVGMVGMFGCAAPCAWDRLIGTVGMVLLCSIILVIVVFSCIFVFFIFFLGLRYFFVFFCLAKLFENLVCFNNGWFGIPFATLTCDI